MDLVTQEECDAGGVSGVGTSGRCVQCGACCFSHAAEYVAVTGDDWARLGTTVDKVAHFIGNKAFMRMVDGHCIALRVMPEGTFVCDVYERRPGTCRDLAEASRECEGERATKGERPGQALLMLRRSRGESTP
jgi:Fe-S-cluster containining protein